MHDRTIAKILGNQSQYVFTRGLIKFNANNCSFYYFVILFMIYIFIYAFLYNSE